ncbi:MAG: hypothetical protein ACJATS_002446, partial [Psychroserpens sp.]
QRVILIITICVGIILTLFRQDLLIKPYHYYRSLSAEIETLEIVIPEQKFALLDSLRSDVLNTSIVKQSHKRYVTASLIRDTDTLKIKIRLKGDQLDHYQTNPPSYRIKILKDKTFLGMNKFSVQSFAMRNFFTEWLYLNLLSQQDVLSLKMDVIRLVINGSEAIYSFEEHFTYHLTDRFSRPRGPIICISEDLFWKNGHVNDSVTYHSEEEIYRRSPLKAFKYYAPLDSVLVKKAKNLLNDFRKNTKTASEVFDINRLAFHYAISDLTNTHHALRWHNNRFYYNSSSEKLEPIGFDGSCWGLLSAFAYDDELLHSIKWSKLFSDKNFVLAYLDHLERVSSDAFLQGFFAQKKNEIHNLENKVYLENLFFRGNQHIRSIYSNAEWIRDNLAGYRKRLLNVNEAE